MATSISPAKTALPAQNDGAEAPSVEALPRALGRYVLLRLLARGGMGEVYLASTTGLEGAERPVVVKVIRREHSKDPSFLARFLDEARVQAQLQHSGVAQIVDAAMEAATGEPYVVVEYVEGKSLGDVRARAIQTGLRFDWADAVAIAIMTAEALAHVHERQDAAGKPLSIVHRDLSPQNLMVGFAGDLKLIDFGTARGQNRRCHTVAGVVFAKPGYVAPEVANGNSGDARVDLYALGIMLWELCAGRRFLQGDAADHMAAVARNESDPPPIAESVGAPIELDAVIAKLTAFDRDARYLAGRAAASDLAKVLATAGALPSGERGVRSRITELMKTLFPGEPARSRREFARLVAGARIHRGALETPPSKAPVVPSKARRDEDRDLLPGTRYRLLSELGRGSSGVVFEAEHADLGRRVALKVLASDHPSAKDYADRFRREARAMSRLSHPNLVKVEDFGVAEGDRLYCVMELLEGETLEQYLAREKGMDWRDALRIAQNALRALEVVHGAGIVHRDIKPANVFLTSDGGLKILDFGLAKTPEDLDASEPPSDEEPRLAGLTLFGTPEYMAPEQAATGRVDARADLYAVGCMLYEMLTGRLPFVEGSHVAILDAKIKGSPEAPRDRAPSRGIPVPVDALVMRAMARHPSVRFQSAAEMLAATERALEAPHVRRSKRRVLGFASLAASMAFAVVLLGGKARELRSMLPHHHVAAPVVAAAAPPPAALEIASPPAALALASPPALPVAAAEPAPAADVPPAAAPAKEPETDEQGATPIVGAALAEKPAAPRGPARKAPIAQARRADKPQPATKSSAAPAEPVVPSPSDAAEPAAVAALDPAAPSADDAPLAAPEAAKPAAAAVKPAASKPLEPVARKGHRPPGTGPARHKRKHRVAKKP